MFSKAQITATEMVARKIGVAPKPFINWARTTGQSFTRITMAGYGTDADRSEVIADFLASL